MLFLWAIWYLPVNLVPLWKFRRDLDPHFHYCESAEWQESSMAHWSPWDAKYNIWSLPSSSRNFCQRSILSPPKNMSCKASCIVPLQDMAIFLAASQCHICAIKTGTINTYIQSGMEIRSSEQDNYNMRKTPELNHNSTTLRTVKQLSAPQMMGSEDRGLHLFHYLWSLHLLPSIPCRPLIGCTQILLVACLYIWSRQCKDCSLLRLCFCEKTGTYNRTKYTVQGGNSADISINAVSYSLTLPDSY